MLPTYDQKEKKKYGELVLEFKREVECETPDLRVLADLIDQLMCHVTAIKSQVGHK